MLVTIDCKFNGIYLFFRFVSFLPCAGVFCLHVCSMYITYVCGFHRGQLSDSPGTGVANRCEYHGTLGIELRSLARTATVLNP